MLYVLDAALTRLPRRPSRGAAFPERFPGRAPLHRPPSLQAGMGTLSLLGRLTYLVAEREDDE